MSKRRNRSRSKKLKQLQELQSAQQLEMLSEQRTQGNTPKKAFMEESLEASKAVDKAEDINSPDEDDEYSDEKVLERARQNIRDWYDYFANNIEQYKDDMSFALGDQWDTGDDASIVMLQKTNLVFNKVYDYVRRVIGKQRKNTVVPEVRPKDFAAKEEDVTLRANLLRAIYQDTDGITVEQTAGACALMGGFGAGVIELEYAHTKTNKQVVRWRALNDPTKAFFDPNANEPTKRDGRFCGYYKTLPKKMLQKEHPEASLIDATPLFPTSSYFSWSAPGDLLTVAYYYEKREIPTMLYTLEDGSEVYKEEYDEHPEIQIFEIIHKRRTHRIEVWGYKMTSNEILEKSQFPVPMLPVVFDEGDSHYFEGQQKTYSLVYHARDPQRFFNYLMSEIADDIKKGRKEQWLGTPENVPDELKRIWQNVEQRQGLLVAIRDKMGQLPTKVPADEVRTSLLQVLPQADSNIQAAMGMFDAYRGEETNATSGIAYKQQALLGSDTTTIYFDNLNKFTQQMASITVALMPYVYDSERYVGLIDDKGNYSTKLVNAHPDTVIEDVGEFDVVIQLTPSLEFEKENAIKLLIDIASLPPETLGKVGDLIVANVPAANVAQLVKRFQMFVDPRILAMEKGEPPPPPQPNPMEEMMKAQMQLEAGKIQNQQAELQSKREERMMNAREKQATLALNEQKLMLDKQKQEMAFQVAQIKANAETNAAYMGQQEKVLSLLAKLATPPKTQQRMSSGG